MHRWQRRALWAALALLFPTVVWTQVGSFPRYRLSGQDGTLASINTSGQLAITTATPTAQAQTPSPSASTFPRVRLSDGSTEQLLAVDSSGRVHVNCPTCGAQSGASTDLNGLIIGNGATLDDIANDVAGKVLVSGSPAAWSANPTLAGLTLSHATAPTLILNQGSNTGYIGISSGALYAQSFAGGAFKIVDSGGSQYFAFTDTGKNFLFGLNTIAGSNAAGVLALGPATPPISSPPDVVQCWGADVAGAATFGLNCMDEGGNVFRIGNGAIVAATSLGTRTNPVYQLTASGFAGTGMYGASGFTLGFAANNATMLALAGGDSEVRIGSGESFGFSSNSNADGATSDVKWYRDAANILAQRNGTNAQEYRVENTFTSSTNREYGKLGWTSNVFRIGTVKGSGGGTARALALTTDDTERWTVGATTGHLVGGSGYAIQTTCVAIASLPAGSTGMRTCVNDQLTACPALDGTFTAGGAVVCSAFYNGTAWVHS